MIVHVSNSTAHAYQVYLAVQGITTATMPSAIPLVWMSTALPALSLSHLPGLATFTWEETFSFKICKGTDGRSNNFTTESRISTNNLGCKVKFNYQRSIDTYTLSDLSPLHISNLMRITTDSSIPPYTNATTVGIGIHHHVAAILPPNNLWPNMNYDFTVVPKYYLGIAKEITKGDIVTNAILSTLIPLNFTGGKSTVNAVLAENNTWKIS